MAIPYKVGQRVLVRYGNRWVKTTVIGHVTAPGGQVYTAVKVYGPNTGLPKLHVRRIR